MNETAAENFADLNTLDLPEWNHIRARPVVIPLDHKRKVLFEIPTVEKYFDFEYMYLQLLTNHLSALAEIKFLNYDEFSDVKLKEEMLKAIIKALQFKAFRDDFIRILQMYFKANFNLKTLFKYINPVQLGFMFLCVHKIVETVKKKLILTLQTVDESLSSLFSTSLKKSSEKIVPRF